MTEPNKAPSLTYGDKVVGALSRGAFILLNQQRSAWASAIHTFVASAVTTTVAIINKNFPTQSIAERAVAGPIKTLLNNSAPEATENINASFDAMYNSVCTMLDARAKSANF